MFCRILLLFAVGQFVSIKSENGLTDTTSIEQKITNEILTNIPVQVRGLWRATPSDQNVQYSPLSFEIALQMAQIKLYYEGVIAAFYDKDKYLEKPYALGGILDKLQQTSNAKLKFINAIVYDQRKTPKQLLNDIKIYYHGENYEISFDSNNNEAVLALVNQWMSNYTKGRSPKIENFSVFGFTNLQLTLMTYTSCWDTPKTSTNFIKVLKFNAPNGEIDIETFNSKETVGYYNNIQKKYEAIRIPYKKGEFAMAIVLPNKNQSLEFLSKFSDKDHLEIMEGVSKHYENIDFAIPFMNMTQISIHENGTNINGDDTIICDWPTAQNTQEVNMIDYKPFYVNRPFAMYIYHEKTKFVLLYALVKNPALGITKYRILDFKISATDQKTELSR